MLNKSFVAIAMLSFLFTATAFGQKEIVVWHAAKGAKNVQPQSPRTGSLIDTSTGEIDWADEVKATPRSKAQPKGRNLIDTSTGEIVWARQGQRNQPGLAARAAGSANQRRQLPFDKGYLPPNTNARQRKR